MPRSLLSLLKESVVRAKLETLTKRITALEADQRSGRLGARVIRARIRYIKKERQQLVGDMLDLGWRV